MWLDCLIAVCILSIPAVLPVVRLSGFSPESVFLLPLAGSILAALAAALELAIGGTLLEWFVVVAIVANGATLANVLLGRQGRHAAGSKPRWPRSAWPVGMAILTFVAVCAALAWPMQPLRARALGYDTNAVWIPHSIDVYTGHDAFYAEVHSAPFSALNENPDYPPALPADTAIGFKVSGHVVYDMEVAMSTVMNAAAIGVLACGIAGATRRRSFGTKALGLLLAAGVCLAAFGIGGATALSGYADLMWSASAVAAIVFGLILPRAPRHFAIAWICATLGALTKNDGLGVGLLIILLLCIRYVPTLSEGSRRRGTLSSRRQAQLQTWVRRLSLAAVLALPAASWWLLMQVEGIKDGFFATSSPQPLSVRLPVIVSGMEENLHLLPAVSAMALIGVLLLRVHRRRLELGNEAWIWTMLAFWLVFNVATYAFGDYEIHWWITTSITRTTEFPQLLLVTDAAFWMIVGATAFEPEQTELALEHELERDDDRAPSVSRTNGATPEPSAHRDTVTATR